MLSSHSESPGRAQSSFSALPSAGKAALFSSEYFSLPQGKCSVVMGGEQLPFCAAGAEERCADSFGPVMFQPCTFSGTVWNAYDLISQITQFYLALSSGDCSWVSPGMGAFKNNVFQLESKEKDFFFFQKYSLDQVYLENYTQSYLESDAE